MFFPRPVDVMRDVKVETAIAIEVTARGARTPLRVGQSNRSRNLRKSSVATIVKELQTAVSSDQQIGKAVVVQITDGNPMRKVTRVFHAGVSTHFLVTKQRSAAP